MGYRIALKSKPRRARNLRAGRITGTNHLRRLIAFFAAAALTFGGSLVMSAPATAAPTDEVTFADAGLADAVNAALGQDPGDPITEAQAATIPELDARNLGISDLSGAEYLTGLTELVLIGNNISDLTNLSGLTGLTYLHLNNNEISDLSGLENLTALTDLYMSGNIISDVAALSGLTRLSSMHLENNAITDVSDLSTLRSIRNLHLMGNKISDVSDLAGLTNLSSLRLTDNYISDISPLSSLVNLRFLYLENQSWNEPDVLTGIATTNLVVDVAGGPVAVSSADPGFVFDNPSNSWTFTDPGLKTLSWQTQVTVGNAADKVFSGTIKQTVTQAPVEWEDAFAQDPEVIQASCSVTGELIAPQINLPTTEGIDYLIEGDVVPGATVSVGAVPRDNFYLKVDPESNWVGSSDFIFASLEITLDEVECETPQEVPTVIEAPNGDLPVNDVCGPDNAQWILPTGDDVPTDFTWHIAEDGLLTAVAHDGFEFAEANTASALKVREYGYAPDTEEPCVTVVEDDVVEDDPVKLVTTGKELPKTGATGVMSGILAVVFLGIGGLVLVSQQRRRKV